MTGKMTTEETIEALELLRILDAPGLSEAVKIAIEALRSQQAGGWISVKEKLPPEPDKSIEDNLELPEYIVIVRGATESTVMHYAGSGEWLYGGDTYPITHWQPLPEPPKGESL